MRVALHTGQLDQPVPGGIGRYVEGLLRHLPEGGVDIARFSGSRWHYEAWHRFRRPAIRLPGAPADLLHAPSLAVPPSGRLPLVVTVHDLAFRTHPDCFPPRGRAFHERGLTLVREEAAAVVVPSRFTAGELEGAGIEAARIHVVPHGIDLPPDAGPAEAGRDPAAHPGTEAVPGPARPPEPETRAVRGGARPPGPYVLFVGTLEPRKGLGMLLAAHAALRDGRPDLGLVVVGARGWGPVIDLDRPGVVVAGRVGDAELDDLYRAAGALALPSRSEGFGLPALEAMARGCPVVASAAGSLPEVVGDAGLLVPAGDADALAAALATVLDDGTEAARRAALGRRRAAGFTWAACVEGHLAAYRAATAAGTPPRSGGVTGVPS